MYIGIRRAMQSSADPGYGDELAGTQVSGETVTIDTVNDIGRSISGLAATLIRGRLLGSLS